MFVTLFVKRIAPALSGVGLLVWDWLTRPGSSSRSALF